MLISSCSKARAPPHPCGGRLITDSQSPRFQMLASEGPFEDSMLEYPNPSAATACAGTRKPTLRLGGRRRANPNRQIEASL